LEFPHLAHKTVTTRCKGDLRAVASHLTGSARVSGDTATIRIKIARPAGEASTAANVAGIFSHGARDALCFGRVRVVLAHRAW